MQIPIPEKKTKIGIKQQDNISSFMGSKKQDRKSWELMRINKNVQGEMR